MMTGALAGPMQAMILTESQALLRDSIERYVNDNPVMLEASGSARPNGAWSDFADRLGILALRFAEDRGGMACGAIETMLVMEQLGSALAAEPFVSNAVVAAALLNPVQGQRAEGLARKISGGEVIVAVALDDRIDVIARRIGSTLELSGEARLVVVGGLADCLLLKARDPMTGDAQLLAVPPALDGIHGIGVTLLDGNDAADFRFDGVRVGSDAVLARNADTLIARGRDAAAAAHCAELVGIMDRMLRDTVAYTNQRVQFGQPLSRFQVLQHRMAAMFVEVELARSMALMAALAVEGPDADRTSAVTAALARALKAARFVAQNAVQLHGGVGTTDELPLGRFFKRVRTLASLLGSADHHIAGFAGIEGARED